MFTTEEINILIEKHMLRGDKVESKQFGNSIYIYVNGKLKLKRLI